MTRLEELLVRIERLESLNNQLQSSLSVVSDDLNDIATELVGLNSESKRNDSKITLISDRIGRLTKIHEAEIKLKQTEWFQHYQMELTKHQGFWTTVLGLLLAIVIGVFLVIEDTHVRDTMSQEQARVNLILDGFKEKLSHHK